MVAIKRPPPSVAPTPLIHNLAQNSQIFRIYDPTQFGAKALAFRFFGPLSRFDHHRSTAPTGSHDPDGGIIYGAPTLSSCLVEVYGDAHTIDIGAEELAILTTKRELKMLDLRGNGAMRAGTVSAVAKESNRSFSQEWSRYFYDNVFLYMEIDGIIFNNAHNDEETYAFYERAASALANDPSEIWPLNAPFLRGAIYSIAIQTGMVVVP